MTDDSRVERIVGGMLRAGVLLAAGIAVLGGCVYFAQHGTAPVDYHAFRGEAASWNIPTIAHGVLAFDGAALLQLGILVLVATPITRVALLVVAFAWERDRLYTAISAVVLAVLLVSVTVA